MDEIDVATLIQGTIGYLDPEYLETHEFSDKSDVYSFGVVLAELLCRRKPLQLRGPEDQKVLATTFTSFLNQGKLENILDHHIVEETDVEVLREISEIAGHCLCTKRADRPSMKDVSMGLHTLAYNRVHSWVPQSTQQTTINVLDSEERMVCDNASVLSSIQETSDSLIHDIEACG